MFSPVATDTDRCKLGSSEDAEEDTVVTAFPRTTIGPHPSLCRRGGLQGTARRPDGEGQTGPAMFPHSRVRAALRGRPPTTTCAVLPFPVLHVNHRNHRPWEASMPPAWAKDKESREMLRRSTFTESAQPLGLVRAEPGTSCGRPGSTAQTALRGAARCAVCVSIQIPPHIYTQNKHWNGDFFSF